jgi:hypothetical protein
MDELKWTEWMKSSPPKDYNPPQSAWQCHTQVFGKFHHLPDELQNTIRDFVPFEMHQTSKTWRSPLLIRQPSHSCQVQWFPRIASAGLPHQGKLPPNCCCWYQHLQVESIGRLFCSKCQTNAKTNINKSSSSGSGRKTTPEVHGNNDDDNNNNNNNNNKNASNKATRANEISLDGDCSNNNNNKKATQPNAYQSQIAGSRKRDE